MDEPVPASRLEEGEVYFGVTFLDDQELVPEMTRLLFLRMDLAGTPSEKAHFQDIGSLAAISHSINSDGEIPSIAIPIEAGAVSGVFEFEQALEALMRCALRRRVREGLPLAGYDASGRLHFEERTLKPYTEPVREADLEVGHIYFDVAFIGKGMRCPHLTPLVYLGKNLEPEDHDDLYFQDAASYLRGVRYSSRTEEDSGFYIRTPALRPRVLEYERALDDLMACSLRRAAETIFEARQLAPDDAPISPAKLVEGRVYFALAYTDRERLNPQLRPVVFVGKSHDRGQLHFQDVLSYRAQVEFGASSREGYPCFLSRLPTAIDDVFDYGMAVEALMRCSLRRSGTATTGSLTFKSRSIPASASQVTSWEIQEGHEYFYVIFTDSQMLYPILSAFVFIGRDLADRDSGKLYFQDVLSSSKGRLASQEPAKDGPPGSGGSGPTGLVSFEEAVRRAYFLGLAPRFAGPVSDSPRGGADAALLFKVDAMRPRLLDFESALDLLLLCALRRSEFREDATPRPVVR